MKRILIPKGAFCTIAMEWLPFEDDLMAQTEQLVLRYNPKWVGHSYKVEPYRMPEWLAADFELETMYGYRENLSFTQDAWRGRMRSCRGIGASLPIQQADSFDNEYRSLLEGYPDPVSICHYIQVCVYRLKS